MFRARNINHIFLTILFLLLGQALYAQTWQKITPGIEYLDLNSKAISKWSHIHVFRIDLHYQQLSLVLAKDLPSHYGSAESFNHHSRALIALNGGFFNPQRNPIGLRISDHQLLNPLKMISWWGVFSINNHGASITAPYDFHPKKGTDFAIQTGPRLLIDGRVPSLKPGFANRTALGINDQGQVIIVVTENMPITTTELAVVMKKNPLN